jgi:hypothetical protein
MSEKETSETRALIEVVADLETRDTAMPDVVSLGAQAPGLMPDQSTREVQEVFNCVWEPPKG